MLTNYQIVKQSQAIHPDWDAKMHLHYLINEEYRDPEKTMYPTRPGETVLDTINRWLNDGVIAR